MAREARRHLRVSRAHHLLALRGQRQRRPDVRRAVEDARPVPDGLEAEAEAGLDDRAPSSPGGDDVRVDVDEAVHGFTLAVGAGVRRLLGAEVEAELRRDGLELAQGAGLELADALAGDAELGADLLERLRESGRSGRSEARARGASARSATRAPPAARRRGGARRGRRAGCSEFSSSSMSPYIESPSPTGVSRLTGSSTRSKSSLTRFTSRPLSTAISSGSGSRFSFCVRMRRGPHDAAHLVDDVHGQADRPALVGDRAGHGLADPPGRVGRELEAHACSRTSPPRGSGPGCPPGSGRGAARRS